MPFFIHLQRLTSLDEYVVYKKIRTKINTGSGQVEKEETGENGETRKNSLFSKTKSK